MIEAAGDVPSPEIELERATITAEQVRRFVAAAGPAVSVEGTEPSAVPLSYALAIRRGHGPELRVSADAFGIHGGHDIELTRPLRIGAEYAVLGRVEGVFEKTGRSGPLTIVQRLVRLVDQQGEQAVSIRDRQILRWRPQRGSEEAATHAPHTERTPGDGTSWAGCDDPELEVGTSVGPLLRPGPSADQISAWASSLRDRETLFHDQARSRRLGFADLVVPGPMQSAFIDHMLRSHLPDWNLRGLSMTFRQSLIAGDRLSIHGVITDADADDRTCDIVIENHGTRETASIGVAHLRRAG